MRITHRGMGTVGWLGVALVVGCSGGGSGQLADTGRPVDDEPPSPGDGGIPPKEEDSGSRPVEPPPPPISVCADSGAAATFATIGEAIAAAAPRATITVCPGTYPERLLIDSKPLEIVGVGGALATIIDAGGGGAVVTVTNTGGAGLNLKGLTIRGGSSPKGAGIACQGSRLVLTDSVLATNHASTGGGGLYAKSCDVDVRATRLEANTGGDRGGGALFEDSAGMISDSDVLGNAAVEGAGLAVIDSDVAVVNNRVLSNVAGLRGGGLYHESDAPILDNLFGENTSGWTGGGIYAGLHGPAITGNTVRNNISMNDGGGIYIHMGAPSIVRNEIVGNQTSDDGGGIRIFTSRAHLEANTVHGNHAGDSGGGIRISHLPAMVVDNIVRDNTATFGGGMDLENDASVIRGGEISGNKADQGGGINATLFPWIGGTIENVRIADNKASWRGGGIAMKDNYQPILLRGLTLVGNRGGSGAALFISASQFTLANSLLAGNTTTVEGGAIYVKVATPWTTCPCPPANTTGLVSFIVAHENTAANGSVLWTSDPGTLTVDSSILFRNSGNALTVAELGRIPRWRFNNTFPEAFSGMAPPTGTDGNIAADPSFVDAAGANFHLAAGSPAIDAGDPISADSDGTRADMGRFGGPGAP